MPGSGCGIIPYCNATPRVYPSPVSTKPCPIKVTVIGSNTRTNTSTVVIPFPTQNKVQSFAAMP